MEPNRRTRARLDAPNRPADLREGHETGSECHVEQCERLVLHHSELPTVVAVQSCVAPLPPHDQRDGIERALEPPRCSADGSQGLARRDGKRAERTVFEATERVTAVARERDPLNPLQVFPPPPFCTRTRRIAGDSVPA